MIILQSAAARFGFWFSRPGNGISHVVHMERFGRPGKTLLGSDSHTPAGGMECFIGTGGLDVALAAAGEPIM
jgi:aconitate hydratase